MPLHQGGRYEIRLQGHLDARWARWFDGLTLSHQPDGTTVIAGEVEDQAALHGLLSRVRDLGLPLITVTQLDTERMAVRNVGFLYHLWSGLHLRLLERRRERWLFIALVAELMRSALEADFCVRYAYAIKEASQAAFDVYEQRELVNLLTAQFGCERGLLLGWVAEDVNQQMVQSTPPSLGSRRRRMCPPGNSEVGTGGSTG
jgi:hypothetical protein